MNLMGWNVGHCRLPLVDMAPEAEEKLAQVMRGIRPDSVIRKKAAGKLYWDVKRSCLS